MGGAGQSPDADADAAPFRRGHPWAQGRLNTETRSVLWRWIRETGDYVGMGLVEFVLARLAEEETEWSSRVDAGGPSGASARRFLEACRAEIRSVTVRRANPRGEPGLDRDLRALALGGWA